MAGQYRFKDSNGNIVAQISASVEGVISFSGSQIDFSQANTISLGEVQLAGTASNALLLDGFDSQAFAFTSSIHPFTASIAGTNTFTSSASTRLNLIETITASNVSRLNSLEEKTGSLATTGSNVFIGTQTITGSLYISSDLVVQGSSSLQNITASAVSIGTNIVSLNTANPAIRYAGLSIGDSGSIGGSGSFLYDSVQDEMIFIHRGANTTVTSSVTLMGPQTFDNVGNETYPTCNRIQKGTGNEHLVDSCITDSGTLVTINSATQINSSITGCGAISTSGTGLNASIRINNTTSSTGKDWHSYSLNNGNFGLYNNTDGNYAYQITSAGVATFTNSVQSTDFRYTNTGYLTYDTANTGTECLVIRKNGTSVLTFNSNSSATFANTVCVNAGLISNTLSISCNSGDDRAMYMALNCSANYNSGTANTIARSVSSLKFLWYNNCWEIGATRGDDTAIQSLVFAKNGSTYLALTCHGIANFSCQICAPQFMGGFVCAVGGLNVRGASTTWSTFNLFPDNPGGAGPQCNTVLAGSIVGCSGWGPQLRFSGASGFIDIGQDCNGGFVVETSDTPRLNITQGGMTGVNNTAPRTFLHIVGAACGADIACGFGNPDARGILHVQACNLVENSNITLENAYGIGQVMQWTSQGMRIGHRILKGGSPGDVHMTAGQDSVKLLIYANGNLGAPSGSNIYNASDCRLKKNIRNISYGICDVMKLQPKVFNWKDNFTPSENGKEMLGFIAQDVQPIVPEVVEQFSDGSDITFDCETISNPLRVNEKFIIPILTKAIQEQQCMIDTLKSCLGIS